MKCFGCYKNDISGYCADCRKKLFDGRQVSHLLSFDAPGAANLPAYQGQTKKLSISGVQLKYSLKLKEDQLVLTENRGAYILKPIPPSLLIMQPGQAPENEHLTMQIASQLFGIAVAANALIFFKDNSPAYITRRFDVRPDGSKNLQEDFAQISGKSKAANGDNFKYDAAYADIGQLIIKNVAAYPPVLEEFFTLVVFNYIFSNGDAHLKNFSLTQTVFGDYRLSKAYDLMCTALHTPTESDTALDLYQDDMTTAFYQAHGYYGRPDFEALAAKIGLLPKRAARIIDRLTGKEPEVISIINRSFLNEPAREKYIDVYKDKVTRFSNHL